jgi:hypothetical protein
VYGEKAVHSDRTSKELKIRSIVNSGSPGGIFEKKEKVTPARE